MAGLSGGWLTGWLLLAGGVFLIAAGTPSLTRVWTSPQEIALPLIAQHARAWRAATIGFAVGTVATAAGLLTLPESVGEMGVTLAWAAAGGYALGAVLWLISLVVRLSVTPIKASGFVATGVIDPVYAPLDRLGGGLFAAFTLIAGVSVVAVGGAILLGGSLPALAGWFAVVIGLVVVGGYLALGDMPPFVLYLPTTVVGIALLLSPG